VTASPIPFWTQAAGPPVAGEAKIGWSTATGFVVSGSGTEERTSFWRSADGLTWTRAEAVDGSQGARVDDLVAGGPGMIAIGAVDSRAAAWTTADAITWKRVPDQTALTPTRNGSGPCYRTELGDAAVSATAIVAVEAEWDGDCEQAARRYLLESEDGSSWHRVYSAPSASSLLERVAYGSSGFVAVGRPTLVSRDGIGWAAVKSPLFLDVAAFDGGYAATTEDSGIFWSDDGRKWSPVQPIDQPVDDWSGFVQVGNTLVLVATEFVGAGDAVRLWTTTDGRRWTPQPADPILDAARDVRLGSDGQRLVLLGFVHEQSGQIVLTDQIR
jgi:hypothetical protein